MNDNGDLREDLKVPDGDLGNQIRTDFENGRELLVSSIFILSNMEMTIVLLYCWVTPFLCHCSAPFWKPAAKSVSLPSKPTQLPKSNSHKNWSFTSNWLPIKNGEKHKKINGKQLWILDLNSTFFNFAYYRLNVNRGEKWVSNLVASFHWISPSLVLVYYYLPRSTQWVNRQTC